MMLMLLLMNGIYGVGRLLRLDTGYHCKGVGGWIDSLPGICKYLVAYTKLCTLDWS